MPLAGWSASHSSWGSDEAHFLRLLLDHVSDCLVAVDPLGRIVLINRPYCELLGGSEADFLGKHVTDVIGPQTRLHLVAQGAGALTAFPLEVRGQKLLAKQVPIMEGGRVVGAVGLALFSNLAALKRAYGRLEQTLAYSRPSQGWRARFSVDDIIGEDPAIETARREIAQAAEHDFPVLISGETGTGKELAAHAIHGLSAQASGPFVWINCASLPADLIESELFGYEGGAFTGAQSRGKPGKFELASGGTLFLDEIGDMPLALQGSLLRVLQTREIVRVGGIAPLDVNVRILCATHRSLKQLVREGRMRADLFYRLATFEIRMPPLRERRDLATLARELIRKRVRMAGLAPRPLLPDHIARLEAYSWPGNVRELETVLTRFLVCGEIRLVELLEGNEGLDETRMDLKSRIERNKTDSVEHALREAQGNRTKAAKLLGISRAHLYRILSNSGPS